jgi:hypothetical protein
LVSEIPSILAGENGELNNTSDAGPFNTVTISTVASYRRHAQHRSKINAERYETKHFTFRRRNVCDECYEKIKKLAENFEIKRECIAQRIQSEINYLVLGFKTLENWQAAKATIDGFAVGINSKFETHVNRGIEIICEVNHKINDRTDD